MDFLAPIFALRRSLSCVRLLIIMAGLSAAATLYLLPVSRVRGYYETVKKENPFKVFSNSGADYEKGSIAEELSHGQSTREVVQALGYDVRTLGNHDFAWGIKELLLFICWR